MFKYYLAYHYEYFGLVAKYNLIYQNELRFKVKI